MDTLIKGAAMGITAAVLGLMLKKTGPELALLLAAAACAAILSGAFAMASDIVAFADDLALESGLSGELMAPVLKCTGIAIVSKLSSDVCKDAGAASAAGAVELLGAASGIAVSIPLLRAVLNIIRGVI